MRLLPLIVLAGTIAGLTRAHTTVSAFPAVSQATAPAQTGLNIRDSAGIAIVEVSAAFMSRLPVWRISSAPIVTEVLRP